eukprot:gnl/TRDRNA2_/TRDRNA2_207186_c0_seq1.p1 gnl/TRDRNA2_/TRDRNA2_207186_c0~~gnl/TRDRNA2_/TRDRNA2_207186_c0_seq1.p1  ORF type:complete len:105 (-),score=18.30 gnl/TRDRNA2_/TRDRNA2_207186_c0_seq1:149-463(-)
MGGSMLVTEKHVDNVSGSTAKAKHESIGSFYLASDFKAPSAEKYRIITGSLTEFDGNEGEDEHCMGIKGQGARIAFAKEERRRKRRRSARTKLLIWEWDRRRQD